MGAKNPGVITPRNCDPSVRQAIQRLSTKVFGLESNPSFAGLTLSGLTASSLLETDASKVLTSIASPLIVGKGGTGAATLTDHGILLGSGTGAVTPLGAATNGQIPIGSTGADPVLATITGTANQVVSTSGIGTITLSTPQDIHTGANPTFAGLTLSGLTATRLVSTDGSSQLESSDIVAWLTGTTDHISMSDDGDGTATIDLDTNTQTLLDSLNGIFLETIDFTVSSVGGTVTGSLEQDGGGDLIQRFSDGYSTLDCTAPQCTIDLTAFVGTDAVPAEVFVYILQSGKTTLVASNSDWPATEHIKIANLLLRSAASTGTDGGALVNRNWNDHVQSADNQGHITHIEEHLRQEDAHYKSGVALTIKNAAGADLTTGNSSTAIELVTAAGTIYQLHKHTFPAFDMYLTATDDVHITNQPTDEGGAYGTSVDLVTDITVYVDGTASGTAITVNRYFNLVVWGVQNRSGEASHIMINLPTGIYTTSSNAVADVDGFSVFNIPSQFKGEGFLIARLTMRLIAGSQWTYVAQEDLRGQMPPITAGVAVTTTDHSLLANLIAPADDHTQYIKNAEFTQNSGILVGTGVGTFVEEVGATVRTSIGVGTGDSPQFTGLTLAGSLSLGFGDLVSEQNPDAVDAIRLKGTASHTVAGCPASPSGIGHLLGTRVTFRLFVRMVD
ncbi:MAG TPA: hypothetical protein ENI05_02200, partial [Porticoccus sp.]|nr:hypothetical protein [Porticoccus sp.]